MTEKLVSIYTPTYNTSLNIFYQTYDSVLAQEYQNWEWVIVDDGSDEAFYWYLKLRTKKDKRIKLYQINHSGKIGAVKFIATMLARGEYLVELDHDDELTHDCLSEVVKEFEEHPDCGMVYSNFAEYYNDEKRTPHMYPAKYWKYKDTVYKGIDYKESCNFNLYSSKNKFRKGFWGNPILWIEISPNHVRAFRKKSLFEVGGYDPTLNVADDYDLVLRMFMRSKIRHIDKLLYLYRWHIGNRKNTWVERNVEIRRITQESRVKYWEELKKAIREKVDNPEYNQYD